MQRADKTWFTETMQARQVSQRGLAKLLGCNASSVNRLINGHRPIRVAEAETLAVLLGTTVPELLKRAGLRMDGTAGQRLVGYIDGAGEAHIDWSAQGELVPGIPSLPPSAVAIQYRTAGTPRDALDGWLIYVEPPADPASVMGRLALVCLDSGLVMVGMLRRGYRPGTWNVHPVMSPPLESVAVRWATAVLLVRP